MAAARRGGSGRVRIIGGRWRGRWLTVPAVPGLRPTPDRVRETLFNWLQPHLHGARCLDLFAGSGALAFEALSRGAAEVVAVERDGTAVAALQAAAATLQADGLQLQRADALTFLAGTPRPFDVIFLDPPFAADLLPTLLARLTPGWLAAPAWIYLESAPGQAPELPAGWEELRQRRAGDVVYRLVRRA
jgi:16S rRNA (guanine966-N2)-methyltransferase